MNHKFKEENLFFETLKEAEVWADSIANEIHGATINGYITPDYKVAYVLTFLLSQVPEFTVRTAEIQKENQFFYKVWLEDRTDLLY